MNRRRRPQQVRACATAATMAHAEGCAAPPAMQQPSSCSTMLPGWGSKQHPHLCTSQPPRLPSRDNRPCRLSGAARADLSSAAVRASAHRSRLGRHAAGAVRSQHLLRIQRGGSAGVPRVPEDHAVRAMLLPAGRCCLHAPGAGIRHWQSSSGGVLSPGRAAWARGCLAGCHAWVTQHAQQLRACRSKRLNYETSTDHKMRVYKVRPAPQTAGHLQSACEWVVGGPSVWSLPSADWVTPGCVQALRKVDPEAFKKLLDDPHMKVAAGQLPVCLSSPVVKRGGARRRRRCRPT
jgi:hypothetical protein